MTLDPKVKLKDAQTGRLIRPKCTRCSKRREQARMVRWGWSDLHKDYVGQCIPCSVPNLNTEAQR